ncbi:barstar family protein [Pectobacterium sp. CFBP8739]|uniref:barstar family protein n=1 Tax=unclassified Pectobacterium TaxID=2627739 RepID=UPI0015DEEAB7|nr:barstar family protein [Pectobacterium sp. CFBP8739]MBA0169557.1 barstar family protein [Pectobacterium sp. CFBP8739]
MEVNNKQIILDGLSIRTEADFHRALSDLLDFGPYYGRNLDALKDRLCNDVERPVTLIWQNAGQSRAYLGDAFDKITAILEKVKEQDIAFNFDEKFDYVLK